MFRAHWTKRTHDGFVPSSRSGQSAVTTSTAVLVFGGRVSAGKSAEVLEYGRSGWKRLRRGDGPAARTGHSACTWNNFLIIHGGEGEGGRVFDDMWAFNQTTVMWHEVPAKLPPLARRHHALVQLRSGDCDKLFLFGGSTLQQGVASQDLAHCSLRDVRLQTSELWESSLPTKHTPEGRWGHSWTKIADSRAILFGGRDTHMQYNDVHLFEAEEHVWQEIFPRGRAPLPCFHHAACTIGRPGSHKRQSVPPSLLVCGGINQVDGEARFPRELYCLDLVNFVWAEVKLGYLFPAPRAQATLVPTSWDDSVILFGGYASTTPDNAVWSLSISYGTSPFPEAETDRDLEGELALDDTTPVAAPATTGGGGGMTVAAADEIMALRKETNRLRRDLGKEKAENHKLKQQAVEMQRNFEARIQRLESSSAAAAAGHREVTAVLKREFQDMQTRYRAARADLAAAVDLLALQQINAARFLQHTAAAETALDADEAET